MQIVRDRDRPRRGIDVELQRVETLGCCFAYPLDLLTRGGQGHRGGIDLLAHLDARREADGVCLAGSQRQRASAAAADEERWMRTLHRNGLGCVVRDRVVLTGEAER